MSQENIELVRLAYDVAFPRRSVEGLLDRFADGFTWHQRPEWPGRPTYTAAEMPQLWADLDEAYSEFDVVPVEYLDSGEYVVVKVEASARLRASNDRIEVTQWHVWRVRDGLAVEARVFVDRREAMEAAALSV